MRLLIVIFAVLATGAWLTLPNVEAITVLKDGSITLTPDDALKLRKVLASQSNALAEQHRIIQQLLVQRDADKECVAKRFRNRKLLLQCFEPLNSKTGEPLVNMER
jgi:hypothetical protein